MSRTEIKYLFLIIITFIAACVETDIYLPAFPDMMAYFSASESAIQNLLTWNFVGICISGPLYGPLSDSFGRKRPLMIALGMFLLGSIITIFAQGFDQMLWGRVLQGLGSGGCFTLGTAIIFDAFQKEKAIQAVNSLNMTIPIIMAFAPMVGGYLNHAYGFRSNFIAIGVLIFISFLISLLFFKETLSEEKRTAFQMNAVLKDFKEAFTSVPFWQITMVISLTFSGYIAFLSGTAVLFVVELGVSKIAFPFFQVAILGAWVLGSLFLNRAIKNLGVSKVKKAGITLFVAGGIMHALSALIDARNPYLLTSGMVLYAFGANWMTGLYFPECMEVLPRIKGIAASLLTSARLLISSIVVGIASSLYNATSYPLILIVVVIVLAILPILILYEKRKSKLSSEAEGLSLQSSQDAINRH